jgi:hypothetical protein
MAVKTGIKPIFIFLTVLVIVIAGGLLWWNNYKYRFIRSESTEHVFTKSNGLYRMRYDKLDLDEVNGNLTVRNLRITPDSTRYQQMIDAKDNPPMIVKITIPELIVRGVKTPKAMINKKIEGRRLEINSPEIVFYFSKAPEDSLAKKEQKAIYEQLLGDLNLISVDTVLVIAANMLFMDYTENREIAKGKNISVTINNVLIDSANSEDRSRFFFSKTTHMIADSFTIATKDNTFRFEADSIDFNSADSSLYLNTFNVIPLMSEQAYAKFVKFQKDRFNIHSNNISIKGVNLEQLQNGSLLADEMRLGSVSLKIFRDLSYPRDKKNRVGTYPQQALMKAPFPIAIKRLIAGPADIELKQKNPKSDQKGTILFLNSSIDATNVTNIREQINEDNHLNIRARTKFMGLTAVDAVFDLRLGDPDGRFTLKGTATGFDAVKLNDILEPLGLAKIEKAKVKNLRFNLGFTDYKGSGTVVFLYEDLKVTLLKKDSADNKIEKKKIASFVSNIILKNGNPYRGKTRIAHPGFPRDTNKSFFHLIWFTIFTGVKETVGL